MQSVTDRLLIKLIQKIQTFAFQSSTSNMALKDVNISLSLFTLILSH